MKTNLNRLIQLQDYLKNKPKIEYTPYPQYSKEIEEVLDNLGFEDDFYVKYALIATKQIKEMNIDDLKVMYSHIRRGERFCDGHIAVNVEDGTLLELLEREIELLNK